MSRLLGWLDSPETAFGMHFATDDGGWEYYDWGEMAARVHDAAAKIAAERRERDAPVAIILPNGPDFEACFFGALAAGNFACPLAGPNLLQDPDGYAQHIAALVKAADPALIISAPRYLELIERAVEMADRVDRCPVRVLDLEPASSEFAVEKPAELALLQFTSGSSGRPRGTRISWSNLEANIGMMEEWLGGDRYSDQIATWLPHYHDMGLIGGMLTPAVEQGHVWVMRPEQFVRRPIRWLECFGKRGATMGASPTFGYAHILRRVKPQQLDGMDFSGWRAAVSGAERVDAAVFSQFGELLEPFGFRASSLIAGYGLAEATLLVCGRSHEKTGSAVKLDWSQLEMGKPVVVTDRAVLGDAAGVGDGSGWLVGCGSTHRGVSLTVLDEEGADLPPGHLGELFVTGRSVAGGYEGGDEVNTAKFVNGGVRTGDAGFVYDGELYVVGRIGDSIKIRGRALYAEDLEARLALVEGIGIGRCAVFTGSGDEGDTVVAVVEGPTAEWADEALQVLADETGGAVRVELLRGRAGTIARTSSGKVRRRVMWRMYAEEGIDAEVVGSIAPGGTAASKPSEVGA
jgi:acyl-CoA synthetase (AMP-forming)/AMP-acid ligase II